MSQTFTPRRPLAVLAAATVAALLAAPAAARADGPGHPVPAAPFLEVSSGLGGAGGLGPSTAASVRFTHWLRPWLGLGTEVVLEGAGQGDGTTPGDALFRTGAALSVSVRQAGPHADAILTVAGGVSHTQATHYALAPSTGGSGASGAGCYDSDPGAGLCLLLGLASGIASLGDAPPPTIPTHADYLAPSVSTSGELVFHSWRHAEVTLGFRADLMAIGRHPIPKGGEGVNLLGTVGLAFR